MKLTWVVALAALMLAGCAVVPVAPYPDPYVAAPGVSIGVGVGVPVYRGGYHHEHGYYRGPYYRHW